MFGVGGDSRGAYRRLLARLAARLETVEARQCAGEWAGIRPGACLCGLGVKRRPREGARTILSPSSTTPQGASDVCRGAEAGEENIFSQISRLLSD